MFKKWFQRRDPLKVGYKVIEVESPRQQTPSKEMQETIKTLAFHPGFIAILNECKLEGAALKNQLNYHRHPDMNAVYFLQAGIYWCNWLQMKLNRLTAQAPKRELDPFEEEGRAFREIDSQIERIE